ncbi:MAG: 7TM diverse intracellular signaling domain-containing protein, partial [Ferruginibacter sp.]
FREGAFNQTGKEAYNAGFTRSVFWLAYMNEAERQPDSLLLYIGHHHINRIHFYYIADGKILNQWITGDYYPFRQRPILATSFYFPIDKKGLYLARIDKSNESLQLSYHLTSRLDAVSGEAESRMIMALFTGMILLLIIFGIYLFAISRDVIYAWYILYIACGWLWVLSNAGYGFQYIWPGLPWFASKARPIFALAPMIFSLLFLQKYIGGIRNKKFLMLIKIVMLFLAASIISILFFNEQGYQSKLWLYIQYFIPIISLAYVITIMGALIVYSLRGNRLALFYLFAMLSLIIFAILQVSFSFGGLSSFTRFFSEFGMSLGYLADAIILTAGLVYRFNQYRKDKENLLLKMNAQQLANTKILMEVQQEERSQVANELHDVAGSLLSAAKFNLSSLIEKKNNLPESTVAQLEKTEEAVSQVSDMVRNLSHALSPVMLEKLGLKTSLEKIIEIFNAPGKINIRLLILGFNEYEPGLHKYYMALYGIIYELLNNIVKHSRAQNALVQVTEHGDAYTLMVEDDGIGLGDKNENLGLAGIKSKIKYLNGSYAADANQPQGLIITIEIPIQQDAL